MLHWLKQFNFHKFFKMLDKKQFAIVYFIISKLKFNFIPANPGSFKLNENEENLYYNDNNHKYENSMDRNIFSFSKDKIDRDVPYAIKNSFTNLSFKLYQMLVQNIIGWPQWLEIRLHSVGIPETCQIKSINYNSFIQIIIPYIQEILVCLLKFFKIWDYTAIVNYNQTNIFQRKDIPHDIFAITMHC